MGNLIALLIQFLAGMFTKQKENQDVSERNITASVNDASAAVGTKVDAVSGTLSDVQSQIEQTKQSVKDLSSATADVGKTIADATVTKLSDLQKSNDVANQSVLQAVAQATATAVQTTNDLKEYIDQKFRELTDPTAAQEAFEKFKV